MSVLSSSPTLRTLKPEMLSLEMFHFDILIDPTEVLSFLLFMTIAKLHSLE